MSVQEARPPFASRPRKSLRGRESKGVLAAAPALASARGSAGFGTRCCGTSGLSSSPLLPEKAPEPRGALHQYKPVQATVPIVFVLLELCSPRAPAAPAGAGGAAELRTTLRFSSPPCSKRCNRCQAPFPPAEKFPAPHNEAGHPSCIPSRPDARVSPAGYRSLAKGKAQREHEGGHQEPQQPPAQCRGASLRPWGLARLDTRPTGSRGPGKAGARPRQARCLL